MTFQITIGWWLAPALITVAAFLRHWWMHKDDQPSYGYGKIGDAIGEALTLALAIITSLVAWLVWALLR